MLSDEALEKVIEVIANRIEQVNTYTLEQIGKTLKKIGTLNPSNTHDLMQILQYGGDYDKIVKKLAQITKLNVKDIKAIIENVAKKDLEFSKQFYNYRQKKFIPYSQNISLKRQVDAITNMLVDNYISKTKAIGFTMKDLNDNVVFKDLRSVYQDTLDKAILSVSQGKTTYQDELYKIIKELGGSGLKTMNYESGRALRFDSAIKMNIKDGIRQLHNKTQKIIGDEIDSDGVEITTHLNPADDHEEAQGKQFSNEQYEQLQETGIATAYDGTQIDLHKELKSGEVAEGFRPISQYNCYHYIFAIILDVNEPQYTNKQLQEIREKNNKGFDYDGKHYSMYEGTQLQRQLETEIRKQKDIQIMAKAGGQDELVQESQKNISILTKKYKELSQASGLPTKMNRLRVSGYRPTKTFESPNKVDSNIIYNVWDKDTIYLSSDRTSIYKKGLQDKIKYYDKEIKEVKKILDERNIPITDNSNNAVIYRTMLKSKENYQKELFGIKEIGDKKIVLNTLEDCKELLSYNNIKMDIETMGNLDFKLIKENTKQIYDLANKYPAIRDEIAKNGFDLKAVYLKDNEKDIIAKTSQYQMILNSEYFKDYNFMYNLNYNSALSNWNMVTPKEYMDRYSLTHEFGHVVDYKLHDLYLAKTNQFKTSQELDAMFIDDFMKYSSKKLGKSQEELIQWYMSDYGKTSKTEAFAELFASSNCDDNYNELSKLFEKWLVKEIDKYSK